MTPFAMSVASRRVLGFDSSMLSVFGRAELALATR